MLTKVVQLYSNDARLKDDEVEYRIDLHSKEPDGIR
jgi:hypothetical protein